jgi:hypothetical protein
MADDDLEVEDAFDKRDHEFVQGQGISEIDYSQLLEMADAHAQAAAVFPNAPAWRQVGPRNLAGRIIALEQDPIDPRVVYAGSAFGGLWRSVDAGDTWERLGDDSHVFPVGAIGVPPAAPNVIYFGTGALNHIDVSGRGLFRATMRAGTAIIERLAAPDSPAVTPGAASPGSAFRYTRIRLDPDEPTRFWAASQTGLWRCECPLARPARPKFTRDLPNAKNQPAGAALATTVDGNGVWPPHCTDLLVARDPRETATVTRGGVEVLRYLLMFVAVDSVGIFRGRFDRREETVEFESSPLTLPIGALNFSRIRLAQCEGKPEHVFAVFADTSVPTTSATEVYHSSNSGKDWTKGATLITAVNAQARQAFYNLVLEVAPDDPKVVVVGAVELCISQDFGNTWTKILDLNQSRNGDWPQHEDQHIALFDRGNHRRLWVGNDGGLALATDLRLPPQADGYWRRRSCGIVGPQAQDVSINPSLPFMCGIGLQDNGTWLTFGGPSWYQINFADGGALGFNLPNPRQVAVTHQRGVLRSDLVAFDQPAPAAPHTDDIVTRAADLPVGVAAGHRLRYRVQGLPTGLAGAPPFVGMVEQHPTVPGQLLTGQVSDAFGAIGDAYSSVDFGAHWLPVMPAPLGSDVTAIAFGPADAHNPVAGNVDGWAGLNTGRLFFTNNAPAGVWAAVATPLPFPGGVGLSISEIAAHPRDRRIVAVSANGIQGRTFITFNQGRTWTDVTEPTPTSLVVAPAGATLQVNKLLPYKATATYAVGGVIDVTARATWTSNHPLQARVESATLQAGVVSHLGREGLVAGLSPVAATITATLIAAGPAGQGLQSQPLTVTNAATPDVPFTPPPRTIVPGSLPPGPIGSVIFDPAPAPGVAATLLAGTLAGVYALPNVPVVSTLEIQPPGPLTFQTGAPAFQLRCVATFSDHALVNATADVDWSVAPPGIIGISNAAPIGQITVVAAGDARITANRGGVSATLDVHVVGGPAAQPVLGAAPAGLVVDPSVPVAWSRFSNGIPQVLVTDFEYVGATNAIRASTFGLGIFEVITTGAPAQQLYIRQTVLEDGRTYPRPAAPLLPDDPRLLPGVLALDYTHAFDIRVDATPFSFFDDVVDGVEFDELLEIADAVPTEVNYVYVQVHNAGTNTVPAVSVHLYAAQCAAADVINPAGGVPTASPASLEAGAPIADFYNPPNFDPLITSNWHRVDTVRVIGDVLSGTPKVARFSWIPDATLGGTNVALLALCTGHAGGPDALPAAPAAATLAAFILAERRAALRVVHVAPRPAAALYIRDGVADDTRVGGYVPGGRSPDIMVVHPDITDTPENAFKDHIARRASDTISQSSANVVYVRVHNRRHFDSLGRVKVFAIPLGDNNEPSRDTAVWTELPSAAAFAEVTVPASGFAYVRVELPPANDPNPTGTNKTYLLLAMIRSGDDTDPLPNRDRINDADAFWGIVSKFSDSDNAAARAIPWAP